MFDIEISRIASFLSSTVGLHPSNLSYLGEGWFSEAYGFTSEGTEFILRINRHLEDFSKDYYAYRHFRSPALPVPEMVAVGPFGDGFNYAVTRRCPGEVSKVPYSAVARQGENSLFETLNAIHDIDVSDAQGYGLTDAEGVGRFESWPGYLNSFYNHKFDFELANLSRRSFLEWALVDRLLKEIAELIPFVAKEKYLYHGDFGFDNVVAKGSRVTGVLDWAECGYGDYLYDVAYLDFWSTEPIGQRWLAWAADRGIRPKRFEERMRLYQLHIGLGSLATEVLTDDRQGYRRVRHRTLSILEPGRRRPSDWRQ